MSFTPVKPISTAFYLTSYFGGLIAAAILCILGAVALGAGAEMTENGHPSAHLSMGVGMVMLVSGAVLAIYASIVIFVLYYKMWEAIQDGYARTTPGKAVGFMIIPFFNIYWMFQAFWGFSKDYNSFIARHSIPAKPLPENLFLIFCIFSLLAAIPYIGGLLGLANMIIFVVLLLKICAGINALANAPAAAAAQSPAANRPLENWRGT